MKAHPFYHKKNTGFSFLHDGKPTQSVIYQPSPEGVIELCDHYSKKYSIDLRCVDLRGKIASGDNISHFFSYLHEQTALLTLDDQTFRGLILSHGQHHVVPVLIAKQGEKQYIIVFDSNSGARIKGYYRIAAGFSDFQFYLNSGTRQADDGSCMTDALCILKEALQLEHLIELIQAKKIIENEPVESVAPPRFFSIPKPDNFTLFKMPDQLLLTAQTSKYLTDAAANLDTIIRGGHSLGLYRKKYCIEVLLSNSEGRTLTPINGYLYHKSQQHQRILDERWNAAEQQRSLSAPPDLITASIARPGLYRPLTACSDPDMPSLNSPMGLFWDGMGSQVSSVFEAGMTPRDLAPSHQASPMKPCDFAPIADPLTRSFKA